MCSDSAACQRRDSQDLPPERITLPATPGAMRSPDGLPALITLDGDAQYQRQDDVDRHKLQPSGHKASADQHRLGLVLLQAVLRHALQPAHVLVRLLPLLQMLRELLLPLLLLLRPRLHIHPTGELEISCLSSISFLILFLDT